jgi:two-component system sensor histidine kinase KdpD
MIQIRQDYVVDVEIPDDFLMCRWITSKWIKFLLTCSVTVQNMRPKDRNNSSYSRLGRKTAAHQVKNQSPHIAEDQLERIFDKFYRMNGFENVTGTGLGLSICKGIIEAHGGKLWLKMNRWSVFLFYSTKILGKIGSDNREGRN